MEHDSPNRHLTCRAEQIIVTVYLERKTMAYVKLISGDSKGTRIDIDRDEIVLGRSPDNAVVINDGSVSGKHCTITRDGRRFTLRDLDSTNGTQLNGVAVSEHQLSPGDVVHVGTVEVLFDGDDIDGYKAIPSQAEETQVTVRMPTTSKNAATEPAFDARTSNRWAGIVVAVIGVIVLLAAMGLFLYRLFVG